MNATQIRKLELTPNKTFELVLKDGRHWDVAFLGEELETNGRAQYYLYHISNSSPPTLSVTTINRTDFLFDGKVISPIYNGNYEPSVIFASRLDGHAIKNKGVSELISKLRALLQEAGL